MPSKISRGIYADMYGPTTGDRVRLADTDLIIEVEHDLTYYGEEVKFGGGKVIREIVEVSGAKVDINDEGIIKIASPNADSIKKAYDMIWSIVAEPEVGQIYTGKVVKLMDFGAFVNFLGAKDGLVHISELANDRVNKTTDIVKDGDAVKVKVIGFDERGKVKLSMRVVDQATGADITEQVGAKRPRPEGDDRRGGERGERRDRDERPSDRGERGERPERRTDRDDRGVRGERTERSARPERGERPDRGGRPERGRQDR